MDTRRAPRGNEARQSMNEPLKLTLQMEAEAMPPKKMICHTLYSGLRRMSSSSAADASFTEISSWMTYPEKKQNERSKSAPRRSQRSLARAHLPVQLVRLLQLADVERRALADELDVGRARRRVVERDEHHVREVHARELDVEHARRRLHLRLQPMRRPPEHHHRARELEDEFLPLDDLRHMARDLHHEKDEKIVSSE